jgi:DNA-binding transcriptional ArsR family regulator
MRTLEERLDQGLAALADATRRELLNRIVARPRRANDLCRGLPMSRPAVSRHLRVLREAGLVEANKRGREQVYRVSPLGIRDVQAYLEEIGRGWDRALEAFKRYAEEER